MCRIGFEKIINQVVPHQRGDNAVYQLRDGILLTLVGMIGGATSIAKLCAVWSDGVLRAIAGWNKMPVETTIGRLFKEVTEQQISQFESVTPKLRGQIWRQANRAGVSKVGLNPVQWVDVDATVDSVAAPKRARPKAITPSKKAHAPTIRHGLFWRAAKKFCKPGLEPEVLIPAMALLNSSSNCWRICQTECVLLFEPIVAILPALY